MTPLVLWWIMVLYRIVWYPPAARKEAFLVAGTIEKNTGATKSVCVYTVADIAKVLNISRNKAYELCHSGVFPIIRVGTTIRVPLGTFKKWMEAPHK